MTQTEQHQPSKFTQELSVTFLSKKTRYAKLNEDLIYECEPLGSNRFVVIPAGFESDGITSPKFLWSVYPPWGHAASRAAMLHDYGIFRWKSNDPHPNIPRRWDIDKEFYYALVACGVNKLSAYLMWCGVRIISVFKELGHKWHLRKTG